MAKIRKSGKKQTNYNCSLCLVSLVFFILIGVLPEDIPKNFVTILVYGWVFGTFGWFGWVLSEQLYNKAKLKSGNIAKNYIALLSSGSYILFIVLTYLKIAASVAFGFIGTFGLNFWLGWFISDYIELENKGDYWNDYANVFGLFLVTSHFISDLVIFSLNPFFLDVLYWIWLMLFIIWFGWLLFNFTFKKMDVSNKDTENFVQIYPKVKNCSVCGYEIRRNAQFCKNCGIELGKK